MTTTAPPRVPARRSDRLDLLAPLAAGWLGLGGALALLGTVTGAGYPFGADDPNREANLLRLVPADLGPPVFAGVLLTAAVLALTLAAPAARPARPVRAVLLGYGWAVASVLTVVVPGMQVLVILGYLPILLVGAPFGWPPVDYADVFTGALAARVASIVGGVLLAGALLVWQRRTSGACAACGRDGADRGWRTPAAAARWGRWAAWTAAAVPFGYALTRFAWAVGIPLGIDPEFLGGMRESGAVWAGAGLGAFATVGAVLTLGLVARWGELFPRWIPVLAGRRVPVALAVVPATVVAIAVTGTGLSALSSASFWDLGDGVVAWGPLLFFPLWGVALGAATYAYHLRRRGACHRCDRG
ncbi:hypothetical protein [Micromonospora endolithica]|uniref:Uncharacterized protein n=1 Tax=Micromonospora endolithica TaxID=230091 RepID=A0A3A9ZMV3_9ACTN|nr:hypothetical protein [Micromonospora endolithica]RKN49603.1 hypothetical protein D7223_09055 [Micromonospora endolithica]TWJ23827.1 hypothetical protein JD76_03970 [Micromonospora endolithica]